MTSKPAVSPIFPIAALAFAAIHIGVEYFGGGVQTHHFLARADLPGFSNWFGLLILPLLGLLLAVRIQLLQRTLGSVALPRFVAIPLAGSILYGALLAASFHFGVQQVSSVAFIGLFLCALALPVYRAEYTLGFVVGMTFTFGSVIPLLFALAFGTLSYVVRRAALWIRALWARRTA